jgi:trehalose 6-phosphate phosphatase
VQPTPAGEAQQSGTTEDALAARLEPLREAPAAAAILCDLDGTLAPIVARPEDSAVPAETREVLRELAGRYALVGIVSGRRAQEARRLVGLDELTYSGNHGFELLGPGAELPVPDPALDGHHQDAAGFIATLDPEELVRLGFRVEDKGAIVALHWRGAPNEGEAEARAHEIVAEAEWQGLVPHLGRKVLEIRPDVSIDKGIAVESLLTGPSISAALYGGDDRTDADAFGALARLREAGRLRASVAVAVASDEAPPGLAEAADVRVHGPAGYLELLRALAA